MKTRFRFRVILLAAFVCLVGFVGGSFAGVAEGPVLEKEMTFTKQYVLLPIQKSGKMTNVDVVIDGENVREFNAEIAPSKDKIYFWAFLDVTMFKDKTGTLKIKGVSQSGLDMIYQADEIPGSDKFYTEALRPQFHFSQKVGWNQDGNGLVYYDGEWHLYFQHNPYGWNEENACWGHAVSKDLIHWEQLPIAMYNKSRSDWAYSGHSFVDKNNAGGWQTGKEKVIVTSWTSRGRGQYISYSNDRGRTYTEYEKPMIPDPSARDPKILWYEPGKHWVMVEAEGHGGPNMAFYNSNDLKNWTLVSRLMDWSACPELIEMPVDGDPKNTRWVVFSFDARYAIGSFDGKKFTPDHEGKLKLHYGNQKEKPVCCYRASQVFNDTPDGRVIQIGWAKIWMHGMPFNQAFSFPHTLTLRTTGEGIRMFGEPIKEIEKIYNVTHIAKRKELFDGKPFSMNVSGDIFDVTAKFEVGDARVVVIDIGGNRIEYNVEKGMLFDAPLKPVDGKVTIRILLDRPIMEVNGNDGKVIVTRHRDRPGRVEKIKAYAIGGDAKLVKIEVNELESIWKK